MLKNYRVKFKKVENRYKYSLPLDDNHLLKFLSTLPEGYELKKIDASLVEETSLHEVSEDLTSQYDSNEDYIKRGVGYCLLKDGQVVCGASSYSIYDSGIEIEVGTHPEHRRKGLATVVSSALILEYLDRGLYLSWDASYLNSVALAQKIGYIMEEPYDTYYINYKKINSRIQNVKLSKC